MLKAFKIMVAAILITHTSYASAFLDKNEVILNASEAFAISGFKKNNIVDISWTIENGYYMYKKSFKLRNPNNEYSFQILSSNESTFSDEYFGEAQIFKGQLSLRFELEKDFNMDSMLVYFQGCSESGFCYPLQKLYLSDIIF
ncbi:protein-disulfide reductase DsbD family protein [Gammaproteobacteria bacterium]|nr:protein-disulfide reductase DsbD family protein [Gammaproteobacteria bacterium]